MLFAINYSPQAAELVEIGAIDIDLFKCPTASDPVVQEHCPTLLDIARRCKPIYIHFPLNALDLGDVDWNEIDEALEKTEAHYVNAHLFASVSSFTQIPADS